MTDSQVPPFDKLLTEREELRELVDTLWGILTIDLVLQLEKDSPEVVEACKANHEIVCHEPALHCGRCHRPLPHTEPEQAACLAMQLAGEG